MKTIPSLASNEFRLEILPGAVGVSLGIDWFAADLVVGILAIVFACMTSGFAAVYFEYMLKRGTSGKDVSC